MWIIEGEINGFFVVDKIKGIYIGRYSNGVDYGCNMFFDWYGFWVFWYFFLIEVKKS